MIEIEGSPAMREALIDLGAIRHNVQSIRDRIGQAQLMAVVKADAYGHGAIPVAFAAVIAGADWLGVVDIDEALALRAAGIPVPILAWLHGRDADFEAAVAADIDLGISSLDQLERAASAEGTARVQLKVDTGLSRNGIVADDCPTIFARAVELELAGAIRVTGIFSHLANAGDDEDTAQLETFSSIVEQARFAGLSPAIVHLASSAAALRRPDARFDLVRIGIGLYGLSPFDDETSADLGLRPAMRLDAEVVSLKRVAAGSGVSYGFTYRVERETTLALVPLGYGDGVPRQASNAGPVTINGTRYRVAGRVAMDQIVVDIGDDDVRVGDRAVLFGDPAAGLPSADEWAEAASTINYEIVTRIGQRVVRRYMP